MSFDALNALEAAGHPVVHLTDAQRNVFAMLDESEVDFLNELKARLDETAGEVQGQDLKLL